MRHRLSAGIVRFAAVLLLAAATVIGALAAGSSQLRAPGAPLEAQPPQAAAEGPVGAIGAIGTTNASAASTGVAGASSAPAAGSADLLEQLSAAARLDPALERAVLGVAMSSLTASVAGEPLPDPHAMVDAARVGGEAATLLKAGRSGVFVTAVMNNQVRACVGSIWANTTSLAREIGYYGALAAARDLRRLPIHRRELGQIELAVSVVGRLERAARGDTWDPARFGVFVRSGARTGVILP